MAEWKRSRSTSGVVGVEGTKTKGEETVGAGGTESKKAADSAEVVGSRETAIVIAVDTTKKAVVLEKTQTGLTG